MLRTIKIFLLFLISFSVNADQTLVIENAWIREAPPTVNVLAAYVTFKNPTDRDIILTSVNSPAFKNVMFHKTEMKDGLAKMRHADEIVIPAHSSFELAPGGVHMMLMGKNTALKLEDQVEFNLSFENINDQKIIATVKKTAAHINTQK
ncbi:MAG: copper chaperone PCu(A)C [Gammaproteobacteria bacterium]